MRDVQPARSRIEALVIETNCRAGQRNVGDGLKRGLLAQIRFHLRIYIRTQQQEGEAITDNGGKSSDVHSVTRLESAPQALAGGVAVTRLHSSGCKLQCGPNSFADGLLVSESRSSNVLQCHPGAIEDNDFIGRFAPRLAACDNLAQLRMDISPCHNTGI